MSSQKNTPNDDEWMSEMFGEATIYQVKVKNNIEPLEVLYCHVQK